MMEEDGAPGKDRPVRSKRQLSTMTSAGEQPRESAPPAEQPSLVSVLVDTAPAAAVRAPGDQAFDACREKPPDHANKLTDSGADISAVNHRRVLEGAGHSLHTGKETQPKLANSSSFPRPMEAEALNTASAPFAPVMVYEGSAVPMASSNQHQNTPSGFLALPANTTDDAKLVDHYEQTARLSSSASANRTGLGESPASKVVSLLGSDQQQHHQQRQVHQKYANNHITQAQPKSTSEKEMPDPAGSTLPNLEVTSATNETPTVTQNAAAVTPNQMPPELGLVSQLAGLGQRKPNEPDGKNERLVEPLSGTGNILHQSADCVPVTTTASQQTQHLNYQQPEIEKPTQASTPRADSSNDCEAVGAGTGQSLKEILSNIVLEEQVITIKLHRDPPPRRARGDRVDRQPWRRAGPASATDLRAPSNHSALLSEDQITQLSTNDRSGQQRQRPATHRAVSNIETRHDREDFLNSIEDDSPAAIPFAACNTGEDGASGTAGTHQGPSSSSSLLARSTSDGPFQQGRPTTRQERLPALTKPRDLGRPSSTPVAPADEDRRNRRSPNVVITHTGRRSAPVFSRRGFGTAEFWNSGQTSINRAIFRKIFSRPPSSASGRRSRAEDRDGFGRERSLSVGAERRGHRGRRLHNGILLEDELADGRASAPTVSGRSGKGKRSHKRTGYGSVEERGFRRSLGEYSSEARDLMSSRFSRQDSRDGYWDESDDPREEQLFMDGRAAGPRTRGPGLKGGGFRSQRRATPRSLLFVDTRDYSARPLSVQSVERGGEPVASSKKSRADRDETGRVGEGFGDDAKGSDSDSSQDEDERTALLKDTKTAIYARRWYLLFLFSVMALVWNAIWSTWGPIAQSAKQVYGWGDGDIAMFTWLGNMPFLVTMFPIAYLMDVKGMRTATVLCCGLMCLGAGLRCIPCDNETATWLIRLGQLLNGVAGTVPISGPGLLSGLWFPPNQRATATAISTVMGYLGSCVSFVLGPWLVKEPSLSPINRTSELLSMLGSDGNNSLSNSTESAEQKRGIETILFSEFAAAGLLFLMVMIYFPSKPPLPPSISASVPREEYVAGLKRLVRNKQFWITAIAYSVPIGVYEVWQVVLDVILDPKVSQQTAGWMDFYATIGGCISGLLISRFADLFTRQMKVFLLVFYFLATASMLWFSLLVSGVLPFDVGMVYAAMVVGGVFLDGGAPLFFELVIEVSYPVGEGVTSGCLQMICAGAGVIFLSLVQVKSTGMDWMNWLFTGCITLAIPLLFFIKTNYGRADMDELDFDDSSSSSSSSSSSPSPSDNEDEERAGRRQENVVKEVVDEEEAEVFISGSGDALQKV